MRTSVSLDRKRTGRVDYYEQNAEQYAADTLHIDMSEVYARFLQYVPPRGYILDAGSGSGRDTLAFLNLGYKVDAFDASPALCVISTRLTGVKTKLQRFEDFESEQVYDGIWASASLLHVSQVEMPDALNRLARALRPQGVMYMSFKKGRGERISENGRPYTDFDEHTLLSLIATASSLSTIGVWSWTARSSVDACPGWINALLLKQPAGRK